MSNNRFYDITATLSSVLWSDSSFFQFPRDIVEYNAHPREKHIERPS